MELNENSNIRIIFVAAVVPFIIGGTLWIANIADKTFANETEVKDLKSIVLELRDHSIATEQDVKWIKERLKKK